ncbi:MAG: T9SS type A sorting domain-containing protein [Chitinophagales bacterium]
MKKIIPFFLMCVVFLLSSNTYAQCDDFAIEFSENCVGETTADVLITIVGGTAPYSIAGTFNDGAYEDNTLTISVEDNEEYIIDVTDAEGCNASLARSTFCSKCLNDAGDVVEANTGSVNLQTICSGESITVVALNAVVDANNPEDPSSTLIYALHTSASNQAGDIILVEVTNSVEGNIENGTISYADAIAAGAIPGVTYYISSVVGPDSDGDGLPDVLGDECTVIAPGLAVIFTEGFTVSLNVDIDCNPTTGVATITANVTGGDAGTMYNVSGIFNGVVADGADFVIEDVGDGAWSLSATAADGGACVVPASVQDVIECDKNVVEWLSFEGEVVEAGNMLNWATASEIDNEYFTIERSADGVYFEVIGVEEGAGNSSASINYQFMDRTAPSGVSYYQITQYDFDGESTSTNVISLTRGERNFDINGISPVPAINYVELSFTAMGNQNIDLTLYDLTGREMLKSVLDAQEGGNRFVVDIASLSPGIYLVSLNNGSKVITKKLIKE